MLTAIISTLAVCTGLSLTATPVQAYRPNPSAHSTYLGGEDGVETIQQGQQFPWYPEINEQIYNEQIGNYLLESEVERIKQWQRDQRFDYYHKGSLYGATYNFKGVDEFDTPTVETAPRFFEWDPTGKTGSTRAAHIINDSESFRRSHMDIGYPNAFAGLGGKNRYFMVNDHSWADAVAALSIFDQAEIGEALLINPSDSLTPFNREFLKSKTENHNEGVDVTFIGGPQVLSDRLRDEINTIQGKVNRVYGASRIETMIAAARTVRQYLHEARHVSGLYVWGDFDNIRITRAYAPPSSNPSTAYADVIGTNGVNATTIFSTSDKLHPATESFLLKESHFGQCDESIRITLIGGPEALSHKVKDDIHALDCEGEGHHIRRFSGGNRFETNLLDVLKPGLDRGIDPSLVFARLPGVIIVDGESPDMWQIAIAARMAFPDFSLVFVGKDHIPDVTARFLTSFGQSYRLTSNPIWRINPLFKHPSYTTRTVLCYQSSEICTKVRSLMNDQKNFSLMPVVTDDPARPLQS